MVHIYASFLALLHIFSLKKKKENLSVITSVYSFISETAWKWMILLLTLLCFGVSVINDFCGGIEAAKRKTYSDFSFTLVFFLVK